MKTFEDTLFCLQAFGKAESFYNSESLTYVYHNNYKKDALRIVRDRKDFKLLCEKIISLKISSESYFSLVSLFFAKTLLRARQMSLLFFMNAFLKIKLDKDLKIASQNLSLVQNESAKRLLREFKILQGFKFWILGRSKRNK
jgi:hypothetical protein